MSYNAVDDGVVRHRDRDSFSCTRNEAAACGVGAGVASRSSGSSRRDLRCSPFIARRGRFPVSGKFRPPLPIIAGLVDSLSGRGACRALGGRWVGLRSARDDVRKLRAKPRRAGAHHAGDAVDPSGVAACRVRPALLGSRRRPSDPLPVVARPRSSPRSTSHYAPTVAPFAVPQHTPELVWQQPAARLALPHSERPELPDPGLDREESLDEAACLGRAHARLAIRPPSEQGPTDGQLAKGSSRVGARRGGGSARRSVAFGACRGC
jgi:hypothetical protein